jgi:ribosomal protein L21
MHIPPIGDLITPVRSYSSSSKSTGNDDAGSDNGSDVEDWMEEEDDVDEDEEDDEPRHMPTSSMTMEDSANDDHNSDTDDDISNDNLSREKKTGVVLTSRNILRKENMKVQKEKMAKALHSKVPPNLAKKIEMMKEKEDKQTYSWKGKRQKIPLIESASILSSGIEKLGAQMFEGLNAFSTTSVSSNHNHNRTTEHHIQDTASSRSVLFVGDEAIRAQAMDELDKPQYFLLMKNPCNRKAIVNFMKTIENAKEFLLYPARYRRELLEDICEKNNNNI